MCDRAGRVWRVNDLLVWARKAQRLGWSLDDAGVLAQASVAREGSYRAAAAAVGCSRESLRRLAEEGRASTTTLRKLVAYWETVT